ncbi:hypothetical protein [Williamwhitmania taraxaci]|uniref:Uncharacterized protein n=1 Tax=Williamwhitmania taraxaci TaxID=1640674 RepID=A0A1G6U8H9_9BACT|nr:hypothetical protein [Williamwhitmania taraxaci]SDD37581.1 hypothetical protein SAMN05216323_11592 [Williamwhitmania taraxaci]
MKKFYLSLLLIAFSEICFASWVKIVTSNECDYLSVCGGGQLAHRYSDENGFNNPSIYCSDMKKIIGHIQNRMLQRVPALKEKFGIQELISTETM